MVWVILFLLLYTGLAEGGDGNVSDPPLFVDTKAGDYHLLADSPCIDAGVNDDWMWDGVDLDGNPRIFCGKFSKTVDMGAYEYASWPFTITEVARRPDGKGELTWNSRPGDYYTIWACLDLTAGGWIAVATIPSQGTTTTWSDPQTPTARTLFYRIDID